jgi:hypothetical protein
VFVREGERERERERECVNGQSEQAKERSQRFILRVMFNLSLA